MVLTDVFNNFGSDKKKTTHPGHTRVTVSSYGWDRHNNMGHIRTCITHADLYLGDINLPL